jgi:hypothetical protein
MPAFRRSSTSALNAQEVQLRPKAGLYLPTRISTQNGVLHVRQKIGMTIGARLTLSFNERFAVVSGITYIPMYVTFHRAGDRLDVGSGSHLFTATTGARYWLLRPTQGMLSWEVHTNVGMAAGGQLGYRDLFERSTVIGVVGTAVRYQVGRIVSITLRVQERLCRIRLSGGELGHSRSPFDVSFGLGLPFLESAP